MDIVRDHAPVDVAQRFLDGADFFMKGGSLEKGLGLSTANGSRHPAKLYFTYKRNLALCEALSLFDGRRTQRIELLIVQIDLFEHYSWPAYRTDEEPPSGWNQLRKLLFIIFKYTEKSGTILPRSPSQFHTIVRSLNE